MVECRICPKEDNKGNMENTSCASSGTLKVKGLGFRGLVSNIDSLLEPCPWCIHAQRGSFGDHSRGNILSYRHSRRGSQVKLKGFVQGDIVQ